jgi:DTW domain-containing protein YfiP
MIVTEVSRCLNCRQPWSFCYCAHSLPFPAPFPYPVAHEQCLRCKYHHGDCICHLVHEQEHSEWLSYGFDID